MNQLRLRLCRAKLGQPSLTKLLNPLSELRTAVPSSSLSSKNTNAGHYEYPEMSTSPAAKRSILFLSLAGGGLFLIIEANAIRSGRGSPDGPGFCRRQLFLCAG